MYMPFLNVCAPSNRIKKNRRQRLNRIARRYRETMLGISILHFLKKYIYLFLERVEGREKESERNIGCQLSAYPQPGPGPPPWHVPWLEIKPATLWSTGRHPTCKPHQSGQYSTFSKRRKRQKISKEMRNLNDSNYQFDVYGTLCPTTTKDIFFQVHLGYRLRLTNYGSWNKSQ